jgi:hypothetical protein
MTFNLLGITGQVADRGIRRNPEGFFCRCEEAVLGWSVHWLVDHPKTTSPWVHRNLCYHSRLPVDSMNPSEQQLEYMIHSQVAKMYMCIDGFTYISRPGVYVPLPLEIPAK